MQATVFGAGGFIGGALERYLASRGHDTRGIRRGDETWRGAALGHAFYCIGMTADFRTRPFDTIDAHVSVLAEVLRGSRFESFLYLSSTRVYRHTDTTDEEAWISVNPGDPDDLYALSKLTGEALCRAADAPGIRIARLSNVVGGDFTSQNFVASLIREARERGTMHIRTAPDCAKDYISIGDAVAAFEAIALEGAEPIYNVASGTNFANAEIVETIREATGCRVVWEPGAPTVRFPPIKVDRLRGIHPAPKTDLPALIARIAATILHEAGR